MYVRLDSARPRVELEARARRHHAPSEPLGAAQMAIDALPCLSPLFVAAAGENGIHSTATPSSFHHLCIAFALPCSALLCTRRDRECLIETKIQLSWQRANNCLSFRARDRPCEFTSKSQVCASLQGGFQTHDAGELRVRRACKVVTVQKGPLSQHTRSDTREPIPMPALSSPGKGTPQSQKPTKSQKKNRSRKQSRREKKSFLVRLRQSSARKQPMMSRLER